MPALPLDSYEAAKASARSLREQVITRKMPPWYADPEQSVPFGNDARLSEADINTLVAWVDGGAARGGASAPPRPNLPNGWLDPQGRSPDAIVSLPEVKLPAAGELPYVRLLIKVTLQQDQWITGLQPLPGNSAAVHHMAITEVTLADGVTPENMAQLDAVARQLGMPAGALASPRPSIVDPDEPNRYDMLSAYTPGTAYESYGEGAGKLLRAGPNQYINFNIHYTTTGKPEVDQSRLGLWFASHPPANQLYRAPLPGLVIVAQGRELLTDDPGTRAEGTDFAIPPIPAYAEEYELVGVTALLKPLMIYGLQPHAHLRGRSFRYVAVFPDGREQTLLSVPNYDFHWQLTYQLREPLRLPAGSKLIVTGRYDNSEHNSHLRTAAAQDPSRRCGPDKLVHFREQNQTWDEMFAPIVQYGVTRPNAIESGPRDGSGREVRLVATAGCLVQRDAGWFLTRIGRFESTTKQSTSNAERSALAMLPSGKQSVRLIGERPFDRALSRQRRVAAKGVLVQDEQGIRLNVTSLQIVDGTCGR